MVHQAGHYLALVSFDFSGFQPTWSAVVFILTHFIRPIIALIVVVDIRRGKGTHVPAALLGLLLAVPATLPATSDAFLVLLTAFLSSSLGTIVMADGLLMLVTRDNGSQNTVLGVIAVLAGAVLLFITAGVRIS